MSAPSWIYLPDGQHVLLPIDTHTWVDKATGVPGEPLRARWLTSDAGGTVAWGRQRPLFQGFASLAQSIPTATFTVITGLSELVDNYAGHSDIANTGRYYVPDTNSNTTGGDWYLCSGYVPFNSADATTPFTVSLRVNGTTTFEGGKVPSGAGHVVDSMVIDLMQMHGRHNDYVEVGGRQVTGAAVNTIVSGKSPSLTVRWVAADQAWFDFATPALPANPHVWTAADTYTGSVTGAGKVPLNTELRDMVRFFNNPPIARLTSEASTQTIPGGGVFTSIQFPTETVDTYGGHDNVTNNTRYTCQRAGLYLISGYASIAEGAGGGVNNGYRAARLLHTFAAGGTTTYAGWSCLPQASTGTTGTAIYATALVRMAAGDFIETQLAHTQTNVTVARTVNTAINNCSRMIAVWMAA
jgi:hypothetical protein